MCQIDLILMCLNLVSWIYGLDLGLLFLSNRSCLLYFCHSCTESYLKPRAQTLQSWVMTFFFNFSIIQWFSLHCIIAVNGPGSYYSRSWFPNPGITLNTYLVLAYHDYFNLWNISFPWLFSIPITTMLVQAVAILAWSIPTGIPDYHLHRSIYPVFCPSQYLLEYSDHVTFW